MGLGPSTKMTTLHHYRCPVTKTLTAENEIEFTGIIINGISESYDDKIFNAQRTADLAQMLQADGAIVAIDGWGNHHVDFVQVIEQLGKRGIPSVGLSYIGQQGRLVCDSPYVNCIIDFNKNASGYESCIVGDNNLNAYDAFKAVKLLENRIKKSGGWKIPGNKREQRVRCLTKKIFSVKEMRCGETVSLKNGVLTIESGIGRSLSLSDRIREISVHILPPGRHRIFVNSNLDFSPLACKVQGNPGEGISHVLSGVTLMLTGAEEETGWQPANIGSSEGILENQVRWNQAGTPSSSDYILHVDVLFRRGEARTAEGILAAHQAADQIAEKIRAVLRSAADAEPYRTEKTYDILRPGAAKVILVKLVSGLGNMYDTVLFPREPAGCLGGHNIRECRNLPWAISPNQCRDGVIHSLL